MTFPPDKALWLALLTDPQVDRAQAKAALYRWAIVDQGRMQELAGLGADALRERLPELDAAQAAAWAGALGRADAAERTLAAWRQRGVDMLTRADAAYPENWAQRLAERWLPYVLFYRGNLELLANPAVCIAGAETPSEGGAALAEELGALLGPGAHVLLGGYGQGVDRLALTAGSRTLGRTILILPVGLGQAGPILRTGQSAVDQGRRLELSPFEPDATYTPALGRARMLLVTALAEALALVEPDAGPGEWPGLDALRDDGGCILVWQGGDAGLVATWEQAGARRFGAAAQAEDMIAAHLLPSTKEIALTDEEAAEAPDAAPIHFEDAGSAIRKLGETGRVPDKLARRLREAQERGLLGQD